jgi:heme/copper-type cytochrome/quinol oxidase subunit 4
VEGLSPGAFVALLVVSVCLSLLVFSHAHRHGNAHATAWGVVAFLFAGLGVAVYFGRFLWTLRRRRRY